MLELQLTNELRDDVINYMLTKSYAVGTTLIYEHHIRLIFKKYSILNKDNLLKIVRKYKQPYHRAILSLINEYCFFNDVDFKMMIPKQMKSKRKLPGILSHEEIKTMVNSVPKPYDLFLRTLFGFGAGLRVSEVIRLSWQRFNWYDWLSDKEKNGLYEVIDTKRGSNFHVTVPKKLMESYYQLAVEKDWLNEFKIPIEGVVYDFGINTWDQSLKTLDLNLWKNRYVKHAYNWIRYNLIQKYCEKVIGKKIHIHWLRHSRATYLLEQDIPLEEISKLLGHADIQTSLIYAKINMRKVQQRMENIETI